MNTTKYNIPDINFSSFESKIAKINKKAKKLNCTEITYTVKRSYIVKANPLRLFGSYDTTWFVVDVTGETPMLNGWKFNGILEPLEMPDSTPRNMIKAVPGETIPTEFRDRVGECDHCKHNRKRNKTYVVENIKTNEIKMVGSSCLKDFLGHRDPHQIAKMAELLFDFNMGCTDLEDEFFSGCVQPPETFGIEHFLSWTVSVINKYGWMNRKNARENCCQSTADIVDSFLIPPSGLRGSELTKFNNDLKELTPSDNQKTEAAEAVEWAKNLTETEVKNNDYLYNINTLANFGVVNSKSAGLAAAIIISYRFDKKKKEDNANREIIDSNHVGNIGERIEMIVTPKSIFERSSDYGVTGIHSIQDDSGNHLTWFASGGTSWLDKGTTYKVKATVKDHKEFNGVKQTVINRVKILEIL